MIGTSLIFPTVTSNSNVLVIFHPGTHSESFILSLAILGREKQKLQSYIFQKLSAYASLWKHHRIKIFN